MIINSGIYRIKNLINNKCYIGSSVNVINRLKQHKYNLTKNVHRNNHLQFAWNKYGEDCFAFEIMEYCPLDRIRILEQFYMDKISPEYNQATKATGGNGYANRGKSSWSKGKHFTDEHKLKISLSKIGKKRSPETIARMSASLKGKPSPNKGQKRTDEQRKRMSLAHIGKPSGRKGQAMSKEQKVKLSNSVKRFWNSLSPKNKKKRTDNLFFSKRRK